MANTMSSRRYASQASANDGHSLLRGIGGHRGRRRRMGREDGIYELLEDDIEKAEEAEERAG